MRYPTRIPRIALWLMVVTAVLAGSHSASAQSGPCLAISTDSLVFQGDVCALTPPEGMYDSLWFVIYNCGSGDLVWAITTGDPWLMVSPQYGTNFDSVAVFVDWGAIPGPTPDPGQTLWLTSNVRIFADSATNSPVDIPVLVAVSCSGQSQPRLQASPPSLWLWADPGDVLYDSLYVSEIEGGNIAFQLANLSDWLILPETFAPFTTPSSVTLTIDATGLTPGYYVDTIFVLCNDPGDCTDTVKVPVHLNVQSGPQLGFSPPAFFWSVQPGAAFRDTCWVYDSYGDSAGSLTFSNNSDWLMLPELPDPPGLPYMLVFDVDASALAAGTHVDTIFARADYGPGVEPVYGYVPVALQVQAPPLPQIVVQPYWLQYMVAPDLEVVDSFYVWEWTGDTVPFTFSNNADWLQLPQWEILHTTPEWVPFVLSTQGLAEGAYYDSIFIEANAGDPAGTVHRTIPVTLMVSDTALPQLHVAPYSIRLEVPAGRTTENAAYLHVSELTGGEVGFVTYNWTSWLELDTIPLSPLLTPEVIPIHIHAENLLPGDWYADTVHVYSDEVWNGWLAVQVWVDVVSQYEYELETIPTYYHFIAVQGQGGADTLSVREVEGHNVAFAVDEQADWLMVAPISTPPYATPGDLVVAASATGLAPGLYSHEITIYDPTDDIPTFAPVHVPVQLTVLPAESTLVAAPQYMTAMGEVGDTITKSALVYSPSGNAVPFWLQTAQGSPWLMIRDAGTLHWTPDTIIADLSVLPGMAPGMYRDTIEGLVDVPGKAYPDWLPLIYVTLYVIDSAEYVVLADPPSVNLVSGTDVWFSDSVLVYESQGRSVPFHFFNFSDWLRVYGSYQSGGMTPGWLYLLPNYRGLPPGEYLDSVIIHPDTDGVHFDPVVVPVHLSVTGGGPVVLAEPAWFDITLPPGMSDDFHTVVYEASGQELYFWADVAGGADWIDITSGTGAIPGVHDGIMPDSVFFTVNTSGLSSGFYMDSLVVFNPTDSPYYSDIYVPIRLWVDSGGGPNLGDSLLVPSVTVSAWDSGCAAQPVAVSLAQPIKGATIPLAIPDGAAICSVSTAGLFTENWDYTYFEINESGGFISAVLANSQGLVLSPGVTEVFNVYFSRPPACREDAIIRWDTALMADPYKKLAFTNTNYQTVYPGFDYHRDSTLIPGYEPGDVQNNGGVDIGDLVYMVNYMFKYGPAPCHIDALDLNTDCQLDISDLVRLVDYMFRHIIFVEGSLLPCGCITTGSPAAPKINSSIVMTAAFDGEQTTVSLVSPVDLLGLELTLAGGGPGDPQSLLDEHGVEMFWGARGRSLHLGMADLDGVNAVRSGDRALLQLDGRYQLVSATVVDVEYLTSGAVIENRAHGAAVPSDFNLSQNCPNPFNPDTDIKFSLPHAGQIELTVYNVLGQKVATVASGHHSAGTHTVTWRGTDDTGAPVTSGVYFYRLTQGDRSETRKMVLLK